MRRIFVTLALAAASPALAQGPATPPVPAAAPGSDQKPERLICRREAPIGSMIQSIKRCRTQAEWDAVAVAGSVNADRIVTNNRGLCMPNNPEC